MPTYADLLRGCLVPRRLSFDENVRAKEGGKETTGPFHGPLRFITSHSFRARLCHAKNETPEEEADLEGGMYLTELNNPQGSAA